MLHQALYTIWGGLYTSSFPPKGAGIASTSHFLLVRTESWAGGHFSLELCLPVLLLACGQVGLWICRFRFWGY
jgi:hypothetical protein